jgi:phosphotransferase system enzyme I (PtsI)
MKTIYGIPVSPGVAIGEALIIDNERFRIPQRFVIHDAVAAELERLDAALAAVGSEIERNRQLIDERLGPHYGAIFSAHLQMLRDPHLLQELQGHIQKEHYSSEYAVSVTLRRYAKTLQDLGDGFLSERAADLMDLERSLLANLLGRRREELSHLTTPVIGLAHDLTPSETANLDKRFVLGFATEVGGAGGHTAIVAKGLEIPAVVGAGLFLLDVSGGDMLIVDGSQGVIIVRPDETTLARYREAAVERQNDVRTLSALRDLPAVTLDGEPVHLNANIEFPSEVQACRERRADGVGLYRTEFLYLASDTEPSEQMHYEAYADVVTQMEGRPVTFRTLDLGADKLGLTPSATQEEKNPFLGLRSIRISLRHVAQFRVQLRAILRASVIGPVKIMFPMVTTLDELRRAKSVLSDAMEDLEELGVPFDRNLDIGMMVEVPAAVIMLDRFLSEVDFVSIGTNDLVQYALAVDRTNENVADLYQETDPAVLRLLQMTIDAGKKYGKKVSLCGQMSGNWRHTVLLLGMGLRDFSVPPASILEVKRVVRSVRLSDCQAIAARAMQMESALEVDQFVRSETERLTAGVVEAQSRPERVMTNRKTAKPLEATGNP